MPSFRDLKELIRTVVNFTNIFWAAFMQMEVFSEAFLY